MTTTEGRLTPEHEAEIRSALRTGRKKVSYVFIARDLLRELDAVRKELDARAEVWECSQCGFRFAVEHVNDDGTGAYSCPVCAEARLTRELGEARNALSAIKRVAEGHHNNQPIGALLHSLIIDIPDMCAAAMAKDGGA